MSYKTDRFATDGTTATYSLSGTPIPGSLLVIYNGLIQQEGSDADYTVAGNAVTFTSVSVPSAGSRVQLRYAVSTGSVSAASLPVACAAGLAAGDWQGEYFANMQLFGAPVMVRDDGSGALNLGFTGSPSPACGLPPTQFSVRWTQTATFAAGTYLFVAATDDGHRVYLDGTKIIDHWVANGGDRMTATVPVTAGQHTVVVEYFQNGGAASAAVSWTLQ